MMKRINKCLVCLGILLAAFSTAGIPIASATPGEPTGPYPAHSSTGVTIFIDLHWDAGDSELTYDVYFGTDTQPPLVATHQSETTFDPGILTFNTTYYWQIVAFDNEQQNTPGPIWNFTTSADLAPFHPMVLKGPTAAGKGISLNFTAIAPDPEGDQVYYQWDWDDGNLSGWLGPYVFGVYATTSYQWAQNGSYDVKVRAKDIHGEISEWSSAYPISIQTQIYFTTLRSGYILISVFGYDFAYGYFAFADKLGSSLIISNKEFEINATISENVYRVVFEMENLLFTNERWTWEEENFTAGDKAYGYFALETGIYRSTAYAYNFDGDLIDKTPGEYVLYHQWKFRAAKALLNLLSGGLVQG